MEDASQIDYGEGYRIEYAWTEAGGFEVKNRVVDDLEYEEGGWTVTVHRKFVGDEVMNVSKTTVREEPGRGEGHTTIQYAWSDGAWVPDYKYEDYVGEVPEFDLTRPGAPEEEVDDTWEDHVNSLRSSSSALPSPYSTVSWNWNNGQWVEESRETGKYVVEGNTLTYTDNASSPDSIVYERDAHHRLVRYERYSWTNWRNQLLPTVRYIDAYTYDTNGNLATSSYNDLAGNRDRNGSLTVTYKRVGDYVYHWGPATAITAPRAVGDKEAQFFDLSGRTTRAPRRGVYIVRQGGKSRKVLTRQ